MTNLTKREKEVYNKIINNVEGKSRKELAKELYISAGTFHTHLLRIFEKTGTNTQVELIVKHYHSLMRKNKIEQGDFYGMLD